MKKNTKKQKQISRQIESLAKISSAIVSNQYLNEILQLIVTISAEMMNSKICSIMLLNEEKQEMSIKATQCLSDRYLNKPNIKIGQSISGKALELKEPISVLDVTKEKDYQFPEIAKKEGIVSMLSMPMLVKGKAIGVINSYVAYKHVFTDDEIKILQAVANQAAVAIENTKLMEEMLVVRENLETRKFVDRAKGILMKDNGIDEDKAYRIIHKKSMDTRRPMKEIAEAILMSHDIRKGLS